MRPRSCGGCKGQKGSSAHNHRRPHPIPIVFPLAGKDPAVHITVAETNLAEMEEEMEKAHLLH